MAATASVGSRRRDESEFNLKEWGLKARISRENPSSRRFSGSHIRSFREEYARSFRSNVTVSSTASSPGYSLKEEIDPSTYSFTTALKALQAKTVYSWEYMSPDGLALNSKWNEAEKYICNPKSGEVPLECLSAKSLSARSFRSLITSGITMSAPLIYPSCHHHNQRHFHTMPSISTLEDEEEEDQVQIDEVLAEKKKKSMTRDVGTQSSTPAELISGSPSPAPTPSIEESPRKNNSPLSAEKIHSETVVEKEETAEKDARRNEGDRNKAKKMRSCSKCREGGCLSSWNLWMKRRQKEKKHRQSKNKTSIFFYHVTGC